MDFPKASELFRVFRDEAVSRSDKLTVNAVDRDGSDANIMGYSSAVVGEAVVGQLASVEEGFWLDSALDAKLDRLAWDRYQLIRKPAALAFVNVLFTTTAPAPGAFTIPPGTRVSTADGKEFQTIVGVTFPMGSSGPIPVLARSTLAGIDQNIGTGTIQSLTSQVIGSPVDLAVANDEAASGGDSAEDNDAFKTRIRRFWVSARRGTKGAIESGALAVPGVSRATTFETLQSFGYPSRIVSLVIADRFTDALVLQSGSSMTYDTKSQALAQVVRTALNEFRAFGIPVIVYVAQVRLLQIVLRLRFQASVANTDALAMYARTIVAQFVNELAPGATFDPTDIVRILASIPGLDVFGDEVASPVGAVIPTSPYQVLRTTLAAVTTDSQATMQLQAAG